MEEYIRRSQAFQKRLGEAPLPKKTARYFLFRMACPLMQSRLEKVIDLSRVPVTFLHGNPHIDNYIRTFRGSAMVDFDRSRLGPYCWDIVRFLSSLVLRGEGRVGFLDRRVVEHFIDAYITHFRYPDIPARPLKMVSKVAPQKWQQDSTEYLHGNRKWVRRMRELSLPPNHRLAMAVLKSYLESRSESSLLEEFAVSEVGLVPGSFGKKHFIFSLLPKNTDSHKEPILLDIKEVYAERDTKHFYSPCEHHGQRMILASKLYADGIEEGLGFCTVNRRQYWGRRIPTFAVKVKKNLTRGEQCDFAAAVGSELGKGHRKGLRDPAEAGVLEKDFQTNFDGYYKTSIFFALELSLAFETIQRKLRLQRNFLEW